jgi:hypothetical protein
MVGTVVLFLVQPAHFSEFAGSYAQQSVTERAIIDTAPVEVEGSSKLRSLIVGGSYFLASAACNALTKLVLREAQVGVLPALELNASFARVSVYLRGYFSSHCPGNTLRSFHSF